MVLLVRNHIILTQVEAKMSKKLSALQSHVGRYVNTPFTERSIKLLHKPCLTKRITHTRKRDVPVHTHVTAILTSYRPWMRNATSGVSLQPPTRGGGSHIRSSLRMCRPQDSLFQAIFLAP